ncbi:MAG: hypothetical protein QW156_02065 [Candidatus Aenigmatarchaeota archaeon]
MESFTIGNKRVLAKVFLFVKFEHTTAKELIDSIVDDIKFSSIGYGGYRSKTALRKQLWFGIFGNERCIRVNKFNISSYTIIRSLKATILKCHQFLPTSNLIYIFVFPCFQKFVKDKMNGVLGFSPWKNTILLYITPV